MFARCFALMILVTLISLLFTIHRETADYSVPNRVPLSQCEPWMAQCLYGVGPRTADQISRELRQNNISSLSQRARMQLPQFFIITGELIDHKLD